LVVEEGAADGEGEAREGDEGASSGDESGDEVKEEDPKDVRSKLEAVFAGAMGGVREAPKLSKKKKKRAKKSTNPAVTVAADEEGAGDEETAVAAGEEGEEGNVAKAPVPAAANAADEAVEEEKPVPKKKHVIADDVPEFLRDEGEEDAIFGGSRAKSSKYTTGMFEDDIFGDSKTNIFGDLKEEQQQPKKVRSYEQTLRWSDFPEKERKNCSS